jgi:hypothetical protein
MNRRHFILAILASILLTEAPRISAADILSSAEKSKIEALLAHLEKLTDASFIRNGSAYDAATAAKFLRGKWHAHESDITTANDFITKVATKSSTTGNPYVIRMKNGSEKPCADYLSTVLKSLTK